MSTEEELCVKCGKPAKEFAYGWGWEYRDFDNKKEPFHLFKCLYPGEEPEVVN